MGVVSKNSKLPVPRKSKKFPERFNFFQNKFSNLNKIIKSDLNPRAVIFDLGLSSFQLSDFQRGFSLQTQKSEQKLNEHIFRRMDTFFFQKRNIWVLTNISRFVAL